MSLQGRRGLWQPMPVEYKHGRSKVNDADRLQLCAQAMALEEMLVCEVPEGEIFMKKPGSGNMFPDTGTAQHRADHGG